MKEFFRKIFRRPEKPLGILLYLTGDSHWLGGAQYARNLILALNMISPKKCPPVYLRVSRKRDVTGLEALARESEIVRVDRLTARWTKLDGMTTSWLSDECTVAFPQKGGKAGKRPMDIHWIPDFQYKHYPEYFTHEERDQRDAIYEELLQGCRLLVLSSETARRDFQTFFPKYRHLPVEVLSFHAILEEADLAPDPGKVLEHYNLPQRFLYCANQMWQHKGHDVLFDALAQLKEQGLVIPLVCTGSLDDYRTDNFRQAMLAKIKAFDLETQINFLGIVPRREQVQVYRQAALLVQPSRFEGWSTTVEEARTLHKPIVLSDIPTHREQAPPDALFFRDGDSGSLAEALRRKWQEILVEKPAEIDVNSLLAENLKCGRFYAQRFIAICQKAHEIASR